MHKENKNNNFIQQFLLLRVVPCVQAVEKKKFFAQPFLFEPGYKDNELGDMDVLHQNTYWPQTFECYFECPLVMAVFTI